ncbi:hypothetical protein [Microbacterium yannicii]|uniref:hypothetical protein n=1 Tax=Microbacterium yannicii TaxID=671622 RepID=UPI0002F573DD|nr:hypothetical protein [Microbacterium yannicii]
MVVEPPVDPGDAGIPPAPEPSLSDAALGRRAQILATEHWGLLAARGTAQSEVLTRITIYLTLVSAGLVTIGLLGQATSFDGWFTGAALAILGFLALVGLMTQTRVLNVAEEDLMYVVAMNRLRGAYADLDPSIERYFLAGIADDRLGVERTYSFLRHRNFSHLFGSSFTLIIIVNACVVGLLAGSCVVAGSGAIGWGIAAGVVVALSMVVGFFAYGTWTYRAAWLNHQPLRRTREPGAGRRSTTPTPPLRRAGEIAAARGIRSTAHRGWHPLERSGRRLRLWAYADSTRPPARRFRLHPHARLRCRGPHLAPRPRRRTIGPDATARQGRAAGAGRGGSGALLRRAAHRAPRGDARARPGDAVRPRVGSQPRW